jgi:hypothetical protein
MNSQNAAPPLIYVAPERYDQIGDAIELLPSPLIEFRRLALRGISGSISSSRPVNRSANILRWLRISPADDDVSREGRKL